MRKIIKIVTFYDDGTFSESTPSQQPAMPLPFPFQPYEPMSQCSKCGLKLDQAMGYVCNNHPCPTGLGGAWCSANG